MGSMCISVCVVVKDEVFVCAWYVSILLSKNVLFYNLWIFYVLFHDLRIIYKILSGENTGKYHFCMKYWSVFVVLRISFVRNIEKQIERPERIL